MFTPWVPTNKKVPQTTLVTGNKAKLPAQGMHQRNQAFTLLEMVIAMAIVVLLTGTLLIIGFGNPEKALIEDTLDDIESLVINAKNHSHINQVDCQILLEENRQMVTRERDTNKIIQQLEIPKQYDLQFRTKPKADWQPDIPISVFIGKSGLNTPAGIQLRSKEAKGELQFDPLTGKAKQQIQID